VPHDLLSSFVPPRNQSWRRHWTTLSFTDQFAFRPPDFSTVAIISLLHAVTTLLTTNLYAIVVALDFRKTFGTVRHFAVL